MRATWRMLWLLLAVAAVAGVIWLCVERLPGLTQGHLQQGFLGYRGYQRRPLYPQGGRTLDFPLQLAFLAGLAYLGRKVLRLRL